MIDFLSKDFPIFPHFFEEDKKVTVIVSKAYGGAYDVSEELAENVIIDLDKCGRIILG